MKRIAALSLLLALLLCACAKEQPPAGQQPSEQTSAPTEPAPETPNGPDFGIYNANSTVEETTDGAVKEFIPGTDAYYALRNMGQSLLLFSGDEKTTLTCFTDGQVPVSATIDCRLEPEGESVCICEDRIAYYDRADHTLVTLDVSLKEASRMALPADMVCEPVLSSDGRWLYYYTADALRSFEVSTGISRLLSQSRCDAQEVLKLQFDDSLLECVVDGQTVYISTETGEIRASTTEQTELYTSADRYFARMLQVDRWLMLFGAPGENFLCLKPQWEGERHLLLSRNALAISRNTDTGAEIACYELTGGTKPYAVVLDGLQDVVGIVADEGGSYVWFFATDMESGRQAMYCWTPELSPTGDETPYLEPFYTAESPDTAGLEECTKQANELADRYGIRIRIWQDAVKAVPENYSFEAEYLVAAYQRDLPVLEKALSAFPEDMLRKLGKKSDNGKLTICLIRHAYESNELGSEEFEEGVFFRSDGNAYVVLAMGERLEQAAYHELFHAIDGYVITECNAFDFWGDLNPDGFEYDYSYITNQNREEGKYLEDANRAFIDTYSMSFPKEDRARIIEHAMMEGNEAYFQSKTMQAKLKKLSEGIRKAFEMKDYEEPLLWEQYIK